VRVADGPLDQERLGGVGEQAGGGGQHLQGPGLIPAVPAVVRGMGDGGVFPVQGIEGCEQGWLVGLTAVNR
jgi:hypothetical protein